MPEPKPAPKPADDFLYRACTPEVKALAKQSRKELREQSRKTYAYSVRLAERRN